MERKKILWLCSWYPDKTNLYNGDFIQRHARAASLYNDIHVIYVTADYSGETRGKEKEVVINTVPGLTEQIVYFPAKRSFTGRIKAHYKWLFLYKQALRNYKIRFGKPDGVHLHVAWKAGLAADWCRKMFGWDYLLTEHWTIFQPEDPYPFNDRPLFFRRSVKRIIRDCRLLLPVSRNLGLRIQQSVIHKEFQVINNVADTDLFSCTPDVADTGPSQKFRFIHVSVMTPQKNPEGIIRAFTAVYRQHKNCELVMVGDTAPAIRQFAAGMQLPEDAIHFRGVIPYGQVAAAMKEAAGLILFSHIENSPCVIGEALCCGLPVIATRVGGVPELLDESNGLLVDAGNEAALAGAMQTLLMQYANYDRKRIAEKAAARFSYESIGKQFDSVYRSAFNS
ncbi:MAG: glycosyltransferase [Chitinophagaceae bacterium]